jgi:hypothetical protein
MADLAEKWLKSDGLPEPNGFIENETCVQSDRKVL